MKENKEDLFVIPAFSMMKKRDDAVCAGNASSGEGNTDKDPDEWGDDEESDDTGFTSFTSAF